MALPRVARAAGLSAGPGNKTIATTLLELLAVRGRAAARERGLRAMHLEDAGLAEAPAWLEDAALDRLFEAVDVDAGLARAVGHRLCAPDATGLSLYGLGLATPEKAYRRIQALLPRAEREGRWQVESMGDASAVLTHRSPLRSGHTRAATLQCALRRGQLEAVPGLYGLLPARVSESTCQARGADECRYAVDWQRGERAGRFAGLASGTAAAFIVLVAGSFIDSVSAGETFLFALGVLALGGIAGQGLDLRRQLAAVAGARRGHLALFDQVDAVLAEKLDQIARLDATLESGPGAFGARRGSERGSTFEEDPLEIVDLQRLVARIVERIQPQVADWAELRLEADESLRRVACEPAQIEQVVDELLQNAIEASLGAGDNPTIAIVLCNAPRGVELSIEDQGQALDGELLDETFDPFFDEKSGGIERGVGLPVCLRIVEAHGGELRISNPKHGGTRVTVFLPGVEEL